MVAFLAVLRNLTLARFKNEEGKKSEKAIGKTSHGDWCYVCAINNLGGVNNFYIMSLCKKSDSSRKMMQLMPHCHVIVVIF